MVYQILKIIYKIGEDDWRTKDNTKLKYLEVAGVKKKLEKGIKKKNKSTELWLVYYHICSNFPKWTIKVNQCCL